MNARLSKLIPVSLLAGVVVLFAGCKKKDADIPPPSGSGPGGSIVSAEKNSFKEVTSKLDKGGSFYLYLSTEQFLGGLSKGIATFSNVFSQMPAGQGMGPEVVPRVFQVIDGLVKDSGIEKISGVGASSIAREPGFYYNKIVVHHYEGDGDGMIWTAFGKEPHPLKELDLLPETTVFASYADLDVPLAWKTIEKELKQLHIPELDKGLADLPEKFKEGAGMSLDDLLGSLGGGYGVIFTLDESKQVTLPLPGGPLQIPEPGLALYFKVKNDAIYTRLDQLTIGNPIVSKEDMGGVKTIKLAIQLPLPIALRPTLARSGDYLFLTSSDTLLQEIIAVQTGKKSGYKSTAEFKKLSQGVPSEGNNFSLISEKFGKTFNQAMQGMMSAQAGAMGAQSKKLQDMMMANSVTLAYSVGVNGSEGWEAFGNGSQSMGSAAMILPAVAVGGLLAAIAIPNFVRARTTSQENVCISNLRIIEGAKEQWALENHKQNTDTPTAKDLQPYLGRGPAGELPVCPNDPAESFETSYSINNIGTKPTCKINPAVHRLP